MATRVTVRANARIVLDCRLQAETPALTRDTLAVVSFGPGAAADDDPRRVRVPLAPLAGPAFEVWRTTGAVVSDRADGFAYARSADVLFGQLALAETGPYADAIENAYARIVAFTQAQGLPHLLRCWNYFGDIHQGDGDLERYRQFCVGRHRVLARDPGFETRLPAATVIGSRMPGTLIYFFAVREPGVQVENPRQTSAFRYPRDYAPKSPSFSRAVLLRASGRTQLFVSGTASVVGHASRHPDNTLAQLDETLVNLRTLLASAEPGGAPWQPVILKCYLRDPRDLAAVRAKLAQAFGADAPLAVLEGDICRTDLRVEIEGVYVKK